MASLKITRGTTYAMAFNYTKKASPEAAAEPATLVGATLRFTVKSSEFTDDMDDSDAVIQRDVTDGDADGHAEWTINPEDTAELAPGDYFYDIKVEEAGGAIYKGDEGKIKLYGSPTNRRA